jgi:Domain of unknown function (DUF4270)
MIKNLLAGLILCLFLSACEEPDIVSTDVIPGTDQPGVFFTDTSLVLAFTIQDDPLVSSNSQAPLFLGTLNDQAIGQTAASFYIQMRVSTSVPSIASTAVADSMVLSLAYSDIYGDSTAQHTINVYELGESLSSDSTYQTTDSFALAASMTPLGTIVTVPSTGDSVLVNGVLQAPQIRIPLTNTFTQQIFDHYKSTPTDFLDNTAFLNYFKGLYINDVTDFNGFGDIKGSIITFNPASSVNTVTLFYKDAPGDTVSKSYSFQLGTGSVRSNRVVNTYNTGVVNDSLQTPASLYIQSLNGLKVKVKFPNISNLIKDHPVSINKAELVIKVRSGSEDVIDAHTGFFVYEEDLAGGLSLVADYNESSNVVGGVLDNDTKTYRLDIAQQMQRILNGSVNNFIYLVAGGRAVNAQRTILEGSGSIKLNLTYTIKNN